MLRTTSRRTAPCAALLAALAALAAPAATSVLAAAQDGEGLGASPPMVEVAGAQRGEAYAAKVTLQNRFDTATRITIERAGEVGAWTTTRPGGEFDVPAKADRVVELSIAVPRDAPNGRHEGHLRLVADPKEQPRGSGLAFRAAVAVALEVTVGGDAVVRLRWLDARAEAVEAGTPARVVAWVANEGNVRATARAAAEVLGPDGAGVDAAEAAAEVAPGATAELALPLQVPLPEGAYRARVQAAAGGFAKEVAFQALAPGALGKEGALRLLRHAPWAEAGLPVKVVAVFENTGSAAIARARFTGEVARDGVLVATLASEPRVVPAGTTVELAAFFTPPLPGRYTLRGEVGYDGLATLPNEGLLNVRAAEGAGGGAWLVLLAPAAAAAVLVAWAVRRRRRGR